MENSPHSSEPIEPQPQQNFDKIHSHWAQKLFWAVGQQYPYSVQTDLNQNNLREIESVQFLEGRAFDTPPDYANHGIKQEIIALIGTTGDVFSIVRQYKPDGESVLALAKYFVEDDQLADVRMPDLSPLGLYGARGLSSAKLIAKITDGDEITVGRDHQPGTITNKCTSGNHFKLLYRDKTFTVEDQGSLNGTRILRPANDADLLARSVEENVDLDELRIAAFASPGEFSTWAGNPIDYAAFYPSEIAQ